MGGYVVLPCVGGQPAAILNVEVEIKEGEKSPLTVFTSDAKI